MTDHSERFRIFTVQGELQMMNKILLKCSELHFLVLISIIIYDLQLNLFDNELNRVISYLICIISHYFFLLVL